MCCQMAASVGPCPPPRHADDTMAPLRQQRLGQVASCKAHHARYQDTHGYSRRLLGGIVNQGSVLPLVILEIFARANGGDPVGMALVPIDSLSQTILESDGRLPAQLALAFAAIDGITAIVAGAIRHVANQRFRFTQSLEQGMGQLQVGTFGTAAQVVNLTDPAALPHSENAGTVITNVNPIADILAITVDRHRLITEQITDEQWNQLFRELIGTVVVRTARDKGRKVEGMNIAAHEQI